MMNREAIVGLVAETAVLEEGMVGEALEEEVVAVSGEETVGEATISEEGAVATGMAAAQGIRLTSAGKADLMVEVADAKDRVSSCVTSHELGRRSVSVFSDIPSPAVNRFGAIAETRFPRLKALPVGALYEKHVVDSSRIAGCTAVECPPVDI